ncbi:hypothetical protein ACF0H5_001115 [Mactra antiquata]
METANSTVHSIRLNSEWYFIGINVIFCLPTFFGNLLIIISLVRFPKLLRVRAYILIGNLAVSDLFIGLIVLPLDLCLTVSDAASSSVELCLWYYCLLYTFVGLSVINLFILSLERFSALVGPFRHYSRFTVKRIYIIILFTWFIGVVIGCLPLFGLHADVPEHFYCTSSHLMLPMYKRVVLSVFILASLVNAIMFLIVVKIAVNKLKTLPSSRSTKHKLRKEIRHTRIMLIITGLFIVFWTPFGITTFIPGESLTLYMVKDMTVSFGFINSCLNWIVYGFRCRKFRIAFKSIVYCSCLQKDYKLPNTSYV